MTRRLFVLLIAAGAALRLIALPLPGTGDVRIWKTWASNAAVMGERVLYGVGRHPPEHRLLRYGADEFAVDYPPIALYALGAVGRAYRAWDPSMPDGWRFTAAVKLWAVLADVGLAALAYLVGRRVGATAGGRRAAVAWWLNPAGLLNGAVLGYLDPLMALPAVGAVLAAAAGSGWIAGLLIGVAALTKAQALLVVPAVLLGLVAVDRARQGIALRLGEAAAGCLVVVVAVLAPYASVGALPNVAGALGTLAEHDMLSGQAANPWWLITWATRAWAAAGDVGAWAAWTAPTKILAVSRAVELGFPNPRAVGLALMSCAWAWACWTCRRWRGTAGAAALGAFLVHAYVVLASGVHENHLYLAVPLAVLAAIERPRLAPVALALTALHALNLFLFYGFSEGIGMDVPRTLTLVDTSVLLAFGNTAALAWHASVLRREAGLTAGVRPAETSHGGVRPMSAEGHP